MSEMKYKEYLDWILDKNISFLQKRNDEEKYRQNIEFVHSLGEKCDCVGWSRLDLQQTNAHEIILKIDEFCKNNGWKARGIYTREFIDFDCEWYELNPTEMNESAIVYDTEFVKSTNETELDFNPVKAYKIVPPGIKEWWGNIYVPERISDFIKKEQISDVSLCWATDKGKYQAEQYFVLYPHKKVVRMMRDCNYNYRNKNRKITEIANKLGGALPEIVKVFYDLKIYLPNCYLKDDMPKGEFAYAYIESTADDCGRKEVLIKKNLADKMLSEKIISAKCLRPVYITDIPLPGYSLDNTYECGVPKQSEIEKRNKLYEELIKRERPKRNISENDALKLLRSVKKENPEDFSKPIKKKLAENIPGSLFEQLLVYYKICDGAYLSDEYKFLSFESALKDTETFCKEMEREELIDFDFQDIVFASCPDGDKVILSKEGKVSRISHEDFEETEAWQNIANFFFDVCSER